MKTPRELLLNRHQPVTPKLDALRRAIVAEHVGGPALAEEAPAAFLARLWTELFWSCRRAWMGLAAAWVLVAVLSLAEREHPVTVAAASSSAASVHLRVVLAEQYRLRAELLEGAPPVAPEPRHAPLPAPRSGNETRTGFCPV